MKWTGKEQRKHNEGAPGGSERRGMAQADALLAALSQRIEKHEPLTTAEIVVLRKVIEAYRGWLLLGGLARWLMVGLGMVTALFVASGHIKNWFRSWLI